MKITSFRVRGSRTFPLDMLRYDQCWPNSPDSVDLMMLTPDDRQWIETREIGLNTISKPTIDRWRSFGWHVGG